MFNLLPKDTQFFDLFEGLAVHAVSAAKNLRVLAENFPDIAASIKRIRDDEHAADDLAHSALDRLDRTFITPFDREDIHTLVNDLDSIIDNVDALAKRFNLYHVTSMDPKFIGQCDVLIQATQAVSGAITLLRKSRKLHDLSPHLIEIHRLENAGDEINHAAISNLFDGKHDPLDVLKWKEIHDYVEEAIDGCEDVTHTLERILLKNG